MKKINFFYFIITLSFLGTAMSCSSEETIEETISSTIESSSVTLNYKGNEYVIEVTTDDNGDFILPDTLPHEIEELEFVENLATVISGDKIYFFDTEQEVTTFYNQSINIQEISRTANSSRSNSFDVNRFNRNVRAFEHDFFNGKKLNITRGYQLRDLTLIGFNDIMSSIAVDAQYQNPFVGDEVILYEHKDFRGRSLRFTCELERRDCLFIDGNSNNLIPGQTYRGNPRFRSIPFKLFRKWADKVSSINVKFGTVSVVPPYPSSGGGRTGGGGSGGGGISSDEDAIK